jgi:RNA polymerase sigma factor (sigma-70 family)
MEKEQLVKLVTAAQNGDTSALNDLFSAFYEDVFHMALKTVKDEDLACDIVQETFLEIYQTIGKLQEPAAFVTWTKQITFHQCTRYFKKKKDVIVDENEDGGTIFDNVREESAEFIPDEALDQDEFKKTVLAMLDELSEEQRSATVMYYFDELSVKDIAEIQGVSEGTVKSRLNYARKSMRALVEDYENKNGIKLHTENDFSIFKWLLQPVSNKDLAERRAKVLSESLTNATGVEFSIALEENSSEPTEKAAAPAPKKKMFGGITTTTVVVSLAAAVILIAILLFGFVLKMFDNFFDRFNSFGGFGG